MKINKNSNSYIIAYTIALVLIVGCALAFCSTSLKPAQQANINADKMKQILASIRIVPGKDSIKSDFERYIVDQYVVDSDGNRIEGYQAFNIDVAQQVKLPEDKRLLPVYEARVADGALKYVLPVYGAGLWGPIWGYVAVDSNGSTIYGAFFSHQSETPGLGAEIAKPHFSDQFRGKNFFSDGHFYPVQIVKKGLKPQVDGDYVDGVSGGTITSKGVGEMLDNCISPYSNFLEKLNHKP